MNLINDFTNVLAISIASRVFYIGVAYLSSKAFVAYDKSSLLVDTSFLSFLLRWDAINFYVIASSSYVTEHITAFFPLYPLVVRSVSMHTGLGILASGVMISNVCFCLSALVLYGISIRRYSQRVCLLAIVFFCFNPSSVVYSTMYSESLFTLLFLLSFLFLELRSHKFILFSSLCGITRSNGILFALFTPFAYKRAYVPFVLFLQLAPFACFELYVFLLLKHRRIYLPYSYIQSKYWDQGFLRFYMDAKNIPNAIVALPFIAFSVYLLLSYAASYRKRCDTTIVLMAILAIQTFMAIFLIHAQIFFRFVSFNPIIYWSLAHMVAKKGLARMYIVTTFYFTFGVAYAVLFGAYYPPA